MATNMLCHASIYAGSHHIIAILSVPYSYWALLSVQCTRGRRKGLGDYMCQFFPPRLLGIGYYRYSHHVGVADYMYIGVADYPTPLLVVE